MLREDFLGIGFSFVWLCCWRLLGCPLSGSKSRQLAFGTVTLRSPFFPSFRRRAVNRSSGYKPLFLPRLSQTPHRHAPASWSRWPDADVLTFSPFEVYLAVIAR